MSDRADLAALVERLSEARVLCLGDVMLDRFVYGEVERISPEAPIPVLRVGREESMLGGAGNVVRNLVALGAKAHFVAVVGKDAAGGEIGRHVAALDGVTPALIIDGDRQTSIKTRYLAGAQQMMRADVETPLPVAAAVRDGILDAVRESLAGVDVVVLSDYGKGVLCRAVLDAVIPMARAAGKPVIVDPKGTDYTIYKGASLLTPNRRELAEATRLPVDGDDAIAAAARHLIDGCGLDAVLATRSRDGMTLVQRDGTVSHLPTEAREVFDVSGAGDTVVATLAAALALGAAPDRAAELANVAAGIVVGKVGTAVAYAADVAGALHHQDLTSAEAKFAALQPGLDRIAGWRQRGLRVGFTNGCFDLLHPGHVALLAKARAACDRLVVGLNSDSSVKRLKGDDRPIQNETARAAVLASLASVDMVILFAEETPIDLIAAIRPEVLVKGADYTVETVVGAEIVHKAGGEVLLVDLEPGHSTTATIARMAR